MCDIAGGIGIAASLGSSLLGAQGKQQQASAAAEERMFGAQQSFMDAMSTRQDAFNIKLQTMKQAATLDENREMALAAAADSRRRAPVEAEKISLQGGQLAGRQQAVMSASGIETGYGSALDILADTAETTNVAMRSIMRTGELEAREWEGKERNLRREKEMVEMRGRMAVDAGEYAAQRYEMAGQFGMKAAKSALKAGETSAMGTILGGLGGVAQKWYAMAK